MAATDTDKDIARFTELTRALRDEIRKVFVGQDEVVDGVLTCVIAGGHVAHVHESLHLRAENRGVPMQCLFSGARKVEIDADAVGTAHCGLQVGRGASESSALPGIGGETLPSWGD